MPEAMEKALEKEAVKQYGNADSKKAKSLIYGTMKKKGWVPSTEKQHPGKHLN